MRSRLVPAGAMLLLLSCGVSLQPFVLAPATADPIGSCTATTGTIVAVDFAHWGGPVVRGCGVGQPSGYALLQAAGFSTAGDNHDGPGYVCRIGNEAFQRGTQYPTVENEKCIVTPPVAAYWSYWLAPAGQDTWTYSARGATSDIPRPGEVELWTYGGTDVTGAAGSGVPTFNPDSLRAHNTAPEGGTVPSGPPTTRRSVPTTTTTTATAGEASGPIATAPSSSPDSTVPATTPNRPVAGPVADPAATTTANGSSTSAPPRTSTTRPEPATRIVDALPAVHERAATGSTVPLLIAVALVVVLAGLAAGTMWRRRWQE